MRAMADRHSPSKRGSISFRASELSLLPCPAIQLHFVGTV